MKLKDIKRIVKEVLEEGADEFRLPSGKKYYYLDTDARTG